jgi:predicted dehydrogenase
MSATKINLGMVGLGGWGKFVVRNFANTPNCRLTTICDATPRTLKSQSRLYPQARATTHYEDLLQDRSLDAVALATPAPYHYEMARAALLADKHVYVEKPMTLTSEHAEELVELSEERGRKLMVGHLLEYHPAVQQMKEYVDSGDLGEIYYMYCQRLNLGVVRQHENAFWSLAPHDISIVLYLFGCEPNHIDANGQCFLQPGVEDVVFATLHFPDGRVAHIHVSWLDPHKKRSMVLVGSEKMIVFDDMQTTEKLRVFDKGATVPIDQSTSPVPVHVRHGEILIPHLTMREPLAVETAHFVDAILNDTTPLSDGYDGLRVVRILEKVDAQLRSIQPTYLRRAA